MADTNYISSIVKIIENPSLEMTKSINPNIMSIRLRVQFPHYKNEKRIMTLVFWGNLAEEIIQYYQNNDYILIEGYLSINKKKSPMWTLKKFGQIKITVLKVYPFFLNSNLNSNQV